MARPRTLAGRLRSIASSGARLAIGVDSVAGARTAATFLAGSGVEVLVEVDCGHHRSGVAPAVGRAGRARRRADLPVRGVYTFPGHSYSPDARAVAARDEGVALAGRARPPLHRGRDRDRGRQRRVDALARATPTPRCLTEVRPGVYVFGDAQQWELGSATPDQVALTAVATVVQPRWRPRRPGRRVSKVLGADRASYASGSGRLLEHPDARIVQLSEHHAVVELPGRLPRLGSRVLVVPNHCCSAVNLADELWPTTGSAPWPVTARGRNG